MDFACFVVFDIACLVYGVPRFVSRHHLVRVAADFDDARILCGQLSLIDVSRARRKSGSACLALLKRDTMLQGVLRDDARERFLGRLVGE